MIKSYLVPTVITDVTGKTTTVYRRVDPAAPTAAPLPAPRAHGATTTPDLDSRASTPPSRSLLHRMAPALARQAEAKEKAHLLYDILEVFPNNVQFKDFELTQLRKIKEIIDTVPQIPQREAILGKLKFASERQWSHTKSQDSVRVVNVLHANLEALPSIDYDASFLLNLHGAVEVIDSRAKIQNLDAHLLARQSFPAEAKNVTYEDCVSYVRAVHMHPDKVGSLITYAQVIGKDAVTCVELRYKGVPHGLLDLLEQFPGNEEKVITFVRERGMTIPSVDDVADMLNHHSAINEGWL